MKCKREDSSKSKPSSKGNHAKGWVDKGLKSYNPPKKGSNKIFSGKEGKGNKDKQKQFMSRPTASNLIVHTRYKIAL